MFQQRSFLKKFPQKPSGPPPSPVGNLLYKEHKSYPPPPESSSLDENIQPLCPLQKELDPDSCINADRQAQ